MTIRWAEVTGRWACGSQREKVSGDWWSQLRSELGEQGKAADGSSHDIHVACRLLEWIGWWDEGKGGPKMKWQALGTRSIPKRQPSFAALKGFISFRGLLCPLPLPPWGSPRPQCLSASFACSQCSCSGFCLSRFYFGLFQVVFPLQYQCTTATRDVIFHSVPAAAGHSKCSTTSADCTSTESHVFCFLTTAGSLSCTRKVSVAQQWRDEMLLTWQVFFSFSLTDHLASFSNVKI